MSFRESTMIDVKEVRRLGRVAERAASGARGCYQRTQNQEALRAACLSNGAPRS